MLDRLRAEALRVQEQEGTPNFLHRFSIIVAGANEYVDLFTTFPACRRFLPLMSLTITNRSGEFLDLEINGSDFGQIPAGVIYGLTQEPIWSIRLTNNDATDTTATEVRANFSTPPMGADDLARRVGSGAVPGNLLRRNT
jgi:hypothetical protein